jgi:N-acetylmuramoyl-L-alanine amidase
MNAPLPLRPGSTGEAVVDLQQRLGRAGHACDRDPGGHYGPATEEQVRTFQARRGLRVDGICGAQTWASLVESGLVLGNRLLYLHAPMLRGDDVAELQGLLGSLGFDAGKVDGIYGAATARAVADFQRNYGIAADGVCGYETLRALDRLAQRTRAGEHVAAVHETERLREARPTLAGRRIVVGDLAGLSALARRVQKRLRSRGAVVLPLDGEGSEQAATANRFDAEVYVGLSSLASGPGSVAFYAVDGFHSVGGRRLAELVVGAVQLAVPALEVAPRGMRLPVLRETRMPAIVAELGPSRLVRDNLPRVSDALAAAIGQWAESPS